MRDLNYQLKQLCDRNRDGSYATQPDRARILSHLANQPHDLVYRHMKAGSSRPKHMDVLEPQWQADDVSAGKMKKRMSAMRWWAQTAQRQSDLSVHLLLSEEIGHGLEQVMAVYLGRRGRPSSLNLLSEAHIANHF